MRIRWRRGSRVLLLGGVLVAGACQRADARLEKLTAGISKDSAQVVMATPAAHTDAFLNQGRYLEVQYYPKPGADTAAAKDDRAMAPLVFLGGRLTGWGWAFWDSVATENKIQVAPAK